MRVRLIYLTEFQSCWYAASESLNWGDASDYCKNIGGNLASVQDVAEQSYLINYMDEVVLLTSLYNKPTHEAPQLEALN